MPTGDGRSTPAAPRRRTRQPPAAPTTTSREPERDEDTQGDGDDGRVQAHRLQALEREEQRRERHHRHRGTPSASAAARCPRSQRAAATMPRNSPATGLDAVASIASVPVRAPRSRRCRGSGSASATATRRSPPRHRGRTTPSPNVTRPETALPVIATAPYSAGHRGRSMDLLRTRTSASSAADSGTGDQDGGPDARQRHQVRRQDAVGDRVHAAVRRGCRRCRGGRGRTPPTRPGRRCRRRCSRAATPTAGAGPSRGAARRRRDGKPSG